MHSSLTSVFMPVISTKHATIVFSCSKIMQSRATPNVCYNLDVLQNLLWIIHRKFWRTFTLQLSLLFYPFQPMYVCRKQIYLGYILCTTIATFFKMLKDEKIDYTGTCPWLCHYFVYVQMEELWRHVLSDQLVFMEKENWDIYQELLYVMSISLFCFISRSRDQ